MPSPKPKPEPLRELQGYPDRRPPRQVVNAKRDRPPMPESLSERAQKEWKRVIAICERLGLCTELDHAVFHAYIREWDMCERLFAKLSAEGPWILDKEGIAKRAPWDTSYVHHTQRLQSIISAIGFDPTSRSKVTTAEGKKDPAGELVSFEGGKATKPR